MSNENEIITNEAMPEKWVNLEDIAEHSKFPKSMNGYVMGRSRIKCCTQKCGRRENAYAGQDEVPHKKYKIRCCHFSW